MALGVEADDQRRMVMKLGPRGLLVGIGIGVSASIGLARIPQNRICGIKSADPMTLVVVSLVLIIVGVAACHFPNAPGDESRPDGGGALRITKSSCWIVATTPKTIRPG